MYVYMQSVPRKGGRRFEGSFMGGNGLKGGRMKGVGWGVLGWRGVGRESL